MELGVRCWRCVLVIFEFLELTRAFAVTYVCDCGVVWRLILLGLELEWAGARAFRGGGEGGVALLGGRVCDVVVTPCDLRRLEMAVATRRDSIQSQSLWRRALEL